MVRLLIGVLLGLLLVPGTSWGLKDYKRSMPKKLNSYLSEGVVIGGVAGRGFSLRDVRRKFGKKTKVERVVLDLGDENGAPLMGTSSYFHIEVDSANSRIIMDLSQVQRSKLTESELKKIFSGSPYLALQSIAYDPEDRATNLILNMKRPIQVEIFSPKQANKPGRIILDVAPAPKRAQAKPHQKGKSR